MLAIRHVHSIVRAIVRASVCATCIVRSFIIAGTSFYNSRHGVRSIVRSITTRAAQSKTSLFKIFDHALLRCLTFRCLTLKIQKVRQESRACKAEVRHALRALPSFLTSCLTFASKAWKVGHACLTLRSRA